MVLITRDSVVISGRIPKKSTHHPCPPSPHPLTTNNKPQHFLSSVHRSVWLFSATAMATESMTVLPPTWFCSVTVSTSLMTFRRQDQMVTSQYVRTSTPDTRSHIWCGRHKLGISRQRNRLNHPIQWIWMDRFHTVRGNTLVVQYNRTCNGGVYIIKYNRVANWFALRNEKVDGGRQQVLYLIHACKAFSPK